MNAIGWSQFQIAGGWKWLLWGSGLTGVGVPLLVFANVQSDPKLASATIRMWMAIILSMQGLLLLLVIPARVFSAMKRDRLQKLIESHRLMPTPASRAVLGYILGPNVALLAVVATVMVAGIIIRVASGNDVISWLAQHAMLAVLSLLLCCLCAFFGQAIAQLNPALLGPLLAPLAIVGIQLLPAWNLLLTPLHGNGLYSLRAAEMPLTTFMGFAAQALFGLLFFVGAARRYRRDDKPALGVWWGLALVALWTSASLLGVAFAEDLRGGAFTVATDAPVFVASLAASMLLAIGPVASAAAGTIDWTRRSRIDVHLDERKPISVAAAAVLATCLISTLLLVSPGAIQIQRPGTSLPPLPRGIRLPASAYASYYDIVSPAAAHYLLTAAVILLFAATIALLTMSVVRMRYSPVKANIGWVLLAWGVGPLIDLVARFTLAGGRGREMISPTVLTWSSPPGTLMAIWSNQLSEAMWGMAIQALLLVLAGFGLFSGARSGNTSAPPPVAAGHDDLPAAGEPAVTRSV